MDCDKWPTRLSTRNHSGGAYHRLRSVKARIEELEREAKLPNFETLVGDGWKISEDTDDNRLWIEMDEKPAREVTKHLRATGWKWSPTRVAWIRLLNNNGRYAAGMAAKFLEGAI